jgi:serine/threonine-protein kinase
VHRGGTLLAGRYRVVRHVGSGAMGTVYVARDTTLERDVAVKSVHAEPESDHGRRIMREARLGAGLRHQHLVTVYDVVPEGGALLLVMEYVEGETLADALRRGPLEVPRALAVLRAIADALDHAHERGVVHRDVKPANVLLGPAGAVKLADLGIATADDVSRITRTGGTLGTVAYMAPEQFEPGPVTAAADVYALAAVGFEALAGRRPYPGATAFEVFGRLREDTAVPDLRELVPDAPEQAALALQRGMAKRAEERPSSAGELVAELEAAFAPPAPAPDPTKPHPVVKRPAMEREEPREVEPREVERAEPREVEPREVERAEPREVEPVARAERAARPPSDRTRRRRALLVPLALLAFVGVVVALVVAAGGGDDEEEPQRSEAPRTSARTTERNPATTSTGEARAPGSTPEETVRAFYTRAAEGDLGGAWRLAGPRYKGEYGNSRAAFEDDLGSLRAITFKRLEQTNGSATQATVAIETVAEHTDRTDQCSGTVDTVRAKGARWLIEPFGVRCE